MRKRPLKITGEQSLQSVPISVLEASPVEPLASLEPQEEEHVVGLVPANGALIFFFCPL